MAFLVKTCPTCGSGLVGVGTCPACEATRPRYAHDGQAPGYLWKWTEGMCQLCGADLGYDLRFLHRGLCDDCQAKPKH